MIQFLQGLPLFAQVAIGILLALFSLLVLYIVGKLFFSAVDGIERYFYRKKRLSH